jgi:chaperonin GroES
MNTSGLYPQGFFVVIELDPTEEKTAGGIILPTTTQDKDKLATQEGRLVATGRGAFNYIDDWPESEKPGLGDRVLFKRYAGHLHERDGKSYRLLNDQDIIATIEPEAAEQRRAA